MENNCLSIQLCEISETVDKLKKCVAVETVKNFGIVLKNTKLQETVNVINGSVFRMTELEQKAEEYFKNHRSKYGYSDNDFIKSYKDGYKQGQNDAILALDVHWHTPDEIPTSEEGKSYTVNVLNNHHQIVYYDFCNNCWIDDNSCCEADDFEAWVYLPEYE